MKLLLSKITEQIIQNSQNYSKWKRYNVTYRGIKELGKENNVFGSLGKGLYTVPSSNKIMTNNYGIRYFVVNGRPKNPKVFDTLNNWEIWFQNNLRFKYESLSEFEKNTSIEKEMLKLGYDGIEIKGREIVNFKPKDIKYFRTEDMLKDYFYNNKNP